MYYIVCDRNCSYPDDHKAVWTISDDPRQTGWNTDSGYAGYGLTKAAAQFLCDAANAAVAAGAIGVGICE